MLETDEELEAWPEGSSYSMGTVVVYDDRNLNGTLDLIGSGEEAIDRIVGVDPEILVLYVEGGVPELGEVFDQIQLGYNLVTLERCEEGDECLVRLVPIESVALALGDDPNAQRLMCREAPSFEISSPGIINMGAEVPEQWPAEDDVVQCAGDGSWYRHLDCDFEGSDICSETSNACVMRHWNLQPGPVPTEWPCDVEG